MSSRRANPRLIGGFVIGRIGLLVAAALVFGSFTWAEAMLASVGRAVRVAVRLGWLRRLTEPLSASLSEGLNGRTGQSPTWKDDAKGRV